MYLLVNGIRPENYRWARTRGHGGLYPIRQQRHPEKSSESQWRKSIYKVPGELRAVETNVQNDHNFNIYILINNWLVYKYINYSHINSYINFSC